MYNFFRSRVIAILVDLFAIPVAWYGAYWLRFNLGEIPNGQLLQASYLLPFLLITQFLSFWFVGLYRGIWKFASIPDLIRILKAVFLGMLLALICVNFAPFNVPRSIIPIYLWLLVSFLSGARVLYRWFKSYCSSSFKLGKRALVVGAGQAADLLLRELSKNTVSNSYNVVAIVDDDPVKLGCELHGIRVAGSLDKIPELIDKYDVDIVIIAIPSAKHSVIRKVVEYCKDANIDSRTLPGLNDLVSGNVTVNNLREVSVEDLLGRDEVDLDWKGIGKIISGKRILVTGGGGSIGSELCRQIAYLGPAELTIVDNSEFNLYSIDKDLCEKFPGLNLVACLVDVVDSNAIQRIVQEQNPNIIFHAAAYKHVPLLEHQSRVAVRNNILGTYNVAKAASDNNIETFVLISTDKAVNPANIMGATKRAAEIICQNFNGQSSTQFITVRFGNVLASAGSVIPLFREQLASGKDLTVTHPEVTRYFMTIREATQLILQATVLGKEGEIFVLDMGDPVKIKDLALQMIYLSGKKLGDDVNVVYTGLRPGEKLYEELFYDSENLLPTSHVKIRHAEYSSSDWKDIMFYIDTFKKMCISNEGEEKFKQMLLKMVPEYLGLSKGQQ